MGVKAGDLVKSFASGVEEGFFACHCEFFECFEAVGNEGGRDDEEFFDVRFGEFFELVVGIGLQPGFFAEAGLKGYRVF